MTRRICFSGVLILLGVALIPVSILFGEQKLTEAQLKAIDTCKRKRADCEAGCTGGVGGLLKPPGRLELAACKQKCKETYLTCVFSVRQAAEQIEPGQAGPRPEIAPPKPTPPKIRPGSTSDVGAGQPSIKTSPTTPPVKQGTEAPAASIGKRPSPTPQPR